MLCCCANQLTGFYMRATLAHNGLINTYFGKQTKFHSNSEVQIKKTFASKIFMERNNGLYDQQNASFSYDYTTRKMIRQLSIIFIMSPNQSIKKWNWQSKQHSFKISTRNCCSTLYIINGKTPVKVFIGSATSTKIRIASSCS